MQTLSLWLFMLAFVLPPLAVVCGAVALAITPSTVRLSTAAPAPPEHVAV
jgi:hypothetical protein